MRPLASTTLLSVAFFSTPTFAQQFDDIIITTQKREQSVGNIPLSVTAFSASDLDILGVEQFDDLANFVPGLEVQEQSANNPGFVIRGITSDSGEATIEPRVSIYQDGVSISRSRGSFVEVFDSRVEVARGPQPTLFGRSALIGAISLNSNSPVFDQKSTELKIGMGNLDSLNIDAITNVPLAQDKAAIRAAFRYKKRDGYVDNLLGQNLNGFETIAGRVSIKLAPLNSLDMSLIANFQQDDNSGTAFKSGTFVPTSGVSTSPFTAAAIGSFGGLHEGRDLGLDRDIFSLTGKLDYSLTEHLSLTSITNYREFESYEVFDPDGFSYDLFSFAEISESEQFSQELRINFLDQNGFRGFLGGAYFDESGQQNTPLGIGENIAQALLGGFLFTAPPGTPQDPLPLPLIPTLNANPTSPLFGAPLGVHLEEVTNFGETETWEIFADASYDVTEKLELTGGLRFTSDSKTSGFAADADRPSQLTGVGLLLGTGILSNGQVVEQNGQFEGFSWRVAGQYEASQNINIFANIAKGRTPEVISYNFDARDLSVLQTGTLPDRFETLNAETVNAYEIGFKGRALNDRLKFDISSYIYDYSNFQSTVIDSETGQSQPINAGNASAVGLESYIQFSPSENIEFFSTYALTNAKFDETDKNGNEQEFGGNRFRLTPKHALTLGAKYRVDFGQNEIVLLPVYSWKSDVFFNNDNDRFDGIVDERESSYGVLDTKLILHPKAEEWCFEIHVRNITNKNYLLDAGNVGGIFGIPTFIAAPPRTYGVSVSYSF